MIISFGYITKLKEERLHKSVYGDVDSAQPNPINFFIICVPRLTPANRRRYFYLFLKITWKGKRNNKITNFHTWMLVVLEVTFSNWKSQIRYGTVVPGQLWHKFYYFLFLLNFSEKKTLNVENWGTQCNHYTAYTSSVPFYVSIVTYSTQMQYWIITHLCLLKIYVLKLSKSLKNMSVLIILRV